MSEHKHTHDHDHSHEHAVGPSHDHSHDEGDSYFIDQLCMVGLSGAFGVICLCLWLWQTVFKKPDQQAMLGNLLAPEFFPFVLASGVGLVIIAFTRGWILWHQSRDPVFLKSREHHHDHDHAHEHAHAIQEKSPLQLAVTTAPPHEHGPACDHDHDHAGPQVHVHPPGHADHDEGDHDHGWAPWRYVVILVPIILFLLGLPNRPVGIGDQGHERLIVDFTSIIYEALPFIVLGVLIAGLLEEFVPQQVIARVVNNTTVMVMCVLVFIGLFVVVALTNHLLIFLDRDHLPPVIPWLPVGAVSGLMAIAFIVEMVRRFLFPSLVSGKVILALGVGSLLGLVFPMCECGIIVVMKRLLRKGLPLSVCVAYLLAGPVINVVVMFSTFAAFSSYDKPDQNDVLGGPWNVVAWRVGLSYIVAITTALIVHWQWNRYGNRLLHPSIMRGLKTGGPDADDVAIRSWKDRLNNITQTSLHDFVDIMAFLVLGSVLAAGGKFLIKETDIQSQLREAPAIAILIMMGIAVLFCLCSEADAFVAANFPLFWPDGSKLAFLVLGPMLDLKLLLMYTRVFRARLIYTIVIALVIQIFAYTMVVDAIFGKVHPEETRPMVLPSNVETHLLSIGMGDDPLAQLVHFGVAYRQSGAGEKVSYKNLIEMANRPDTRNQWKDQVVEVLGEFQATPNDHVFDLVRMKITCCGSDAVPIFVRVLMRESVTGYKRGDWVRVTGRVDFREERPGSFKTLLHVSKASDINPSNPDLTPYVQ